MDFKYYDKFIDKRDNSRYDLTPLLNEKIVFRNLIEDLINPFLQDKVDKVAGIESFGFILGSAISQRIHKGFVPIRKSGKIAAIEDVLIRDYFEDYSGYRKGLEIRKDAFLEKEEILIVDDWAETGAQLKSSIGLIEKLGGVVLGICLIGIEENENTLPLFEKYKLNALGVSPYNLE